MYSKAFFYSKTLIFNVLAFTAAISGVIDIEAHNELTLSVFALVNIILRMVTNSKLTLNVK